MNAEHTFGPDIKQVTMLVEYGNGNVQAVRCTGVRDALYQVRDDAQFEAPPHLGSLLYQKTNPPVRYATTFLFKVRAGTGTFTMSMPKDDIIREKVFLGNQGIPQEDV